MANPDNLLTKIHDLLLYLVPQLAKFPRDQKFLLADRLQMRVMDIQEQCLRAYYSRDKQAYLKQANMGIEICRHLIRLSHDLKFFSTQSYGVLCGRLEEIGRMLGGWLKSLRPTQDANPV